MSYMVQIITHNMRLLILLSFCLILACQTPPQAEKEAQLAPIGNPPAEGFNKTASDKKAITIADQVMDAMGGRRAWDTTRILTWNFFGRRTLTWDKQTGDVNIQIPADSLDIRLNVQDSLKGKVMIAGNDLSGNADTLAKYVAQGKSIWINDSYWLVMPFKLKDSGVTLKYVKQDTTALGEMADILSLTFEGVGDTPENKYLVYVDTKDHLVKQWDFYRAASDTTAMFSTPWADYERYGDILLSANRGRARLNNIATYQEMPDSVATRLDF